MMNELYISEQARRSLEHSSRILAWYNVNVILLICNVNGILLINSMLHFAAFVALLQR